MLLVKEIPVDGWILLLLEFQGVRVFVFPKMMTQNIGCEKGFRHELDRLNPICCFLKYAMEHYQSWRFLQRILAKSATSITS